MRPITPTARSAPGRSDQAKGGQGLSEKPFSLKELRAKDLDLHIEAMSVAGTPAPITNLRARIQLTSGLLAISPLEMRVAGAPLTAQLELDARSALPHASFSAGLGVTRLGALRPALAKTLDGDLNGRLSLVGEGASPSALASSLIGEARVNLANGRLAAGPAEALGGDLFKALTAGKGGDAIRLQCAGGRVPIHRGIAAADGLRVYTDVGEADASGTVDLAHQSAALQLMPRARAGDPAQVTAPITIVGPLAKPRLTDHVAATVRRQGVGAALKLVLSPVIGLVPRSAQDFSAVCARMAAGAR